LLAPAQEVGGALVLLHTRQLKDLSGLASLARVGGDLNIVDNSALWTLDGLGKLAEIGRHWVAARWKPPTTDD
jgi:hypothetical protein